MSGAIPPLHPFVLRTGTFYGECTNFVDECGLSISKC